MSNELILTGCISLIICAVASIPSGKYAFSKYIFELGIVFVFLGALVALPHGSRPFFLFTNALFPIIFKLDPSASWLVTLGLIPAFLAGLSIWQDSHSNNWIAAASITIVGAIGVAGLQNGISLLIAWEIMSLGGAYLLLGDRKAKLQESGQSNMFMLALLEVGSIALLLGLVVLGTNDPSFNSFSHSWAQKTTTDAIGIGLLFTIAFGAKLGLLPFYEWYPAAYSTGRGASGAILSGIVLNVTWFALGRSLLAWMPSGKTPVNFGVFIMALGVLSAMFSILYAFQQSDWRKVLSFSTAENAGLATAALGASIMFRSSGLQELSTMAFVVGLIHLGGHSLAKGSLMLTADHIDATTGSYDITQHSAISKTRWTLGVGAVLSAMSLAAMPPMAGFVSEWYIFQTVFHGFTLPSAIGRVSLGLAGAGIAFIAAVSLATMVKVVGVGLLGKHAGKQPQDRLNLKTNSPRPTIVLSLGLMALIYAFGMTWFINLLKYTGWPRNPKAVHHMVDGLLLVPLSSGFAFISPFLLVIVGGLLSLIPIALVRFRPTGIVKYRKVPTWAHGLDSIPLESKTTSLAFSNALRQFYSFIYRPTTIAHSNGNSKGYFVKQVKFEYSEAPIFGPLLFNPTVKLVKWIAKKASPLQMGSMNLYLAYIGIMLLAILVISLLG